MDVFGLPSGVNRPPNRNSSQPQIPGIQGKIFSQREREKVVQNIVGQSQSTFSAIKTAEAAPKSISKVAATTTIANAKVSNAVGDQARKPLQPQSTNCKDDRAKYRDFVHCCKCFSTFYKLRDLALHFDQCPQPYHDFSFKQFRLQLVQVIKKKEQQQKESQCQQEPEAPKVKSASELVKRNHRVVVEPGQVPTNTPSPATPNFQPLDSKRKRKENPATSNVPDLDLVINSPNPGLAEESCLEAGEEVSMDYTNNKEKPVSTSHNVPVPPVSKPNRRKMAMDKMHRPYTPRSVRVCPSRSGKPKRKKPEERTNAYKNDRLGGGLKCCEPACSFLDFPSKTALYLHMRDDHEMDMKRYKDGSTPYNCAECNETFKTSYSLKLHMNRHKGFTSRYKCTLDGCNRRFTHRGHLKLHERKVHRPSTRFPCTFDDCSLSFVTNWELRNHVNLVHLKVTPFKCRDPNCSMMFSTTRERANHYLRDHRPKNFVCPVENCGKAFKFKINHGKHLLTHQDRREREKVVCDFPECGANFLREQSLDYHKMTAHNANRSKDFLCPTCGKAFYNERNLQSHSKVHSQETPHKCSYCGRGFKLRQALTLHLRTHTGERPYFCRHCDKTFTGAGAWHRHEQTHTGFRPYQCKFCGERFLDNRTLKRHVAGQHEDCEFDLSDTCTYQIYIKHPKLVSAITDLEQDCASNNS